ncbi:MAG: PhzF family phenazine biosynthesis isomerase, partial [Candidatus Rokuibacteriota bacterium]
MSGPIPIIQADVFTERPFAGNPAAAVLDADGLDAPAMQRIAAEMLVPGTAFVSAATQPGADWRLRMFTPKREVAYSGHTALCGTHALIESGRLPG